ncbi:DUF445 family protein, partial [Bacillus sp. B-TM1]
WEQVEDVTKKEDTTSEENPEFNGQEDWLQKQVVKLVENNHSKIGKLVQENLDKLDDKTLIEMIENNVGKDLQWIRVNGAVCGFMIGLVLEGIKVII